MHTAIKKPTVGLALGGGAVKGFAHIGLLKLLDKYQLQPSHICGTSMGAIIGALYASGVSGAEIEARVREHLISPEDKLKNIFKKRKKLMRWAKVFGFEKKRGGLVTAEGVFTHLFDELTDIRFDELRIPFTCIATDFNSGKELTLTQGELLPSILASIAVPGVFAPVQLNYEGSQRTLIDGGLSNNLPTSHIQSCDIKIACDVMAIPKYDKPKTLEVINGSINIMIVNATQRSLHENPVDILLEAAADGVDTFDFHKIEKVLDYGEQAAKSIEADIRALSPQI